jgi:hypothetical protein
MYRMMFPLVPDPSSIAKPTESAGLLDLVSIRSAYLFELGSREKVADPALVDFGHPA